jgi:signal transduction histidine kinase
LKSFEKEALLKSFLLFFISLSSLVVILLFMEYKTGVNTLDEKIFSQMRICSYDLKCTKFKIDFAKSKEYECYKLYKENSTLSGYFPIPHVDETVLKIYITKESYIQELQQLQTKLILKYLTIFTVVLILSFFFSIYTLAPLRNALHLTEEFIKDILHDFNTPLSTLRLNSAIIKKRVGEDKNMQRIENSVANILNLQSNLTSYLQNHSQQKEKFELKRLIQERVKTLNNTHNISITLHIKDTITLNTNKNAFTRILDNLLTNALKYNKQDGFIKIRFDKSKLIIEDSGKGIQNPHKIFNRFYKEQERGIGIGLHIVKKLCNELGIKIEVQSDVGVGSCFILECKVIDISV